MEPEVNPEQYFRVKDGRIVKSLKDLVDVLNQIDDETFYHHVNVEKNDFANWVRDVLQDLYLANQLRGIAFSRGYVLLGDWYHRKAMIRAIRKRVKELKNVEDKISLTFEENPDPLVSSLKLALKKDSLQCFSSNVKSLAKKLPFVGSSVKRKEEMDKALTNR